MAWPPPTLPTTRTDTTVMAGTHPADHNAANQAINDTVAWVKPSAWTPVTFQNGWVDFGSGSQTMQYRKTGDNVQVRGVIKSGATGAVITTLPAGFRPPAPLDFNATAYGSAAIPIHCNCASTGTITAYFAGSSPTAVGITFMFSTVA